ADRRAGLAADLGPEGPGPDNDAKSIAAWLGERIPLVWGGEGPTEASALRWKTQFNENTKVAAFHSILPELDHNEIEGLAGEDGSRFAALVLRHDLEHPRMGARVEATLAALAGAGLEGREVRALGSTPLEAVFYLILLGDFTTSYAAS